MPVQRTHVSARPASGLYPDASQVQVLRSELENLASVLTPDAADVDVQAVQHVAGQLLNLAARLSSATTPSPRTAPRTRPHFRVRALPERSPNPTNSVGVIDTWTGAHAAILRAALRMTNERFAERLGVAVRTVAKWNANADLVPTPELQRVLDTTLAQAAEEDRKRFWLMANNVGTNRQAVAA